MRKTKPARIKIDSDEDIKAEILRIITGMKQTKWKYDQSAVMYGKCGCLLGYRASQHGITSKRSDSIASFSALIQIVYSCNTFSLQTLSELFGCGSVNSLLYIINERFGKEFRDLVERRLHSLTRNK